MKVHRLNSNKQRLSVRSSCSMLSYGRAQCMLGIVVCELASQRLWVTNGHGWGWRGTGAGQLLWLSFDLWEQPIGVEDLQLLFKDPFKSPTRRCNRRVGLQSQQSDANPTKHHHQGLSRGTDYQVI